MILNVYRLTLIFDKNNSGIFLSNKNGIENQLSITAFFFPGCMFLSFILCALFKIRHIIFLILRSINFFLYKSLASFSISILTSWNRFSINLVFFDRFLFCNLLRSTNYQKIPSSFINNFRKVEIEIDREARVCIEMIGKLKNSKFLAE